MNTNKNDLLTYLFQFIKSPRRFGSLVPSSRWLCHKMIEQATLSNKIAVAELGAGNGVLTKYILHHLSNNSFLDAYEIQNDLAYQLKKIAIFDKRLRVFPHSAENLENDYDIIFSCLPMLSLKKELRVSIIEQIAIRLNKGGKLVLFQYTPLLEPLLDIYFSWTKVYEIRNIPPAYIYTCICKNPPS